MEFPAVSPAAFWLRLLTRHKLQLEICQTGRGARRRTQSTWPNQLKPAADSHPLLALDQRLIVSLAETRHRQFHDDDAARARAALKPETKRASVVEVAPRGSMTSMSENWPRRATARSSAAFNSLRVLTRSPSPPSAGDMKANAQS